MSKEQPEALPVRLAKRLCDGISTGHDWPNTDDELLRMQSASELRRLHAENESLRAQIGQGEPVAWSPALDYPQYEKERVWCNGKPRQEDIDYWEQHGNGITLAYTHPAPQQIGQGVPDGDILQIDAAVTQAQKVLSDWNEWYGTHGKNAQLPPGGIVKAQELLAVAKSLLASAPPAPQANKTHVLVPLRMTRAMQDVVSEEDWSWADLLAAAEAVTEDEFAAAEQTEPIMPQVSVVQQKPLTDEQQIAEALRKHGFALVKTATGYDVMKLGPCIAHNIGEKK